MEQLEYFKANEPLGDPLPTFRLTVAGVLLWLSSIGPGLTSFSLLLEAWRFHRNAWDAILVLTIAGVCLGAVVLLAWLGTGLFLRRRWAQTIALTVLYVWRTVGIFIIVLATYEIVRQHYPVRLTDLPDLLRWYTVVPWLVVIALALLLPQGMLLLLDNPKATIALRQRDVERRWTDAYTTQQLGLAGMLLSFGLVAGFMSMLAIDEWTRDRPSLALMAVPAALAFLAGGISALLRWRAAWPVSAIADGLAVVGSGLGLYDLAKDGPVYLNYGGVLFCGFVLIACVRLTHYLWLSRPWFTANTQ